MLLPLLLQSSLLLLHTSAGLRRGQSLPQYKPAQLSVPFRGFIFSPPSREFLCKLDSNDGPCDASLLLASQPPLETNATSSGGVPSNWTRVNLSEHLRDHNSTHTELRLRWHDPFDLPEIREYTLLGNRDRLHMTSLHSINVNLRTDTFLDERTGIVSVSHLVPYDKIRRYGSFVSLWTSNELRKTRTFAQTIDYYYEQGVVGIDTYAQDRANTKQLLLDCRTIFDRSECASQGKTIAACDAEFYYECGANGVPRALMRCPSFYIMAAERNSVNCSRIVLQSDGRWHIWEPNKRRRPSH